MNKKTDGAVEAGYIYPEFQIGHSGKIISPKIYIAFGISGSNHHMVGASDIFLWDRVEVSR
ncbi:MAG: FAD-binding protein [Candidatus Hodgkinia cicadicola]